MPEEKDEALDSHIYYFIDERKLVWQSGPKAMAQCFHCIFLKMITSLMAQVKSVAQSFLIDPFEGGFPLYSSIA